MIISLLLLQQNFRDFSVYTFLCFKVNLAFYLSHVLAVFELLLQDNLVRTGEGKRKVYQLNEQFAGRDKIRTLTSE